MFSKKSKDTRMVKESLQDATKGKSKESQEGSSPLLERYLQKTMTDRMQHVGDEVLAKAIQNLLYEEKNKHLN